MEGAVGGTVSEDLLRDDAKVREAFRAGKRWALAEVYRVYFPIVSTVVTRGFGGFRGFYNPADRDDAIQSIFAAAFEERARLKYNGLDPYSAYLRGIAQNLVRRMLEKTARFRRTDGQPELENKVVETAEEQLIGAQSRKAMADFRASLTDQRERDILELYYVEGVAEEKIAAAMQMTRYRVRKVISALDRRMRRHLKAYGVMA